MSLAPLLVSAQQVPPAPQVQAAAPITSAALLRAVEEFRIQTASLSLSPTELASASTLTPNLTPRTAAKAAFHGNLYENIRNDFLDANPHQIVQRNGDKRKLRRNQWGLNLTGPVKIPFLYNGTNKTFFTFQYEGMRESIGQFRLNTIPTTLERTGSWSHVVDAAGNPLPIYDPLSTSVNPAYDPSRAVSPANLEYLRQQFPGNVIPVSRLDPVAQAALQHYPQPNTAAGPFFQNNFFNVTPQKNSADGFNTTVDHTFLQKNRLTVRVGRSTGLNGNAPVFLTVANPNNPDADVASRSLRVEHIYTASATNINTLRFEANSEVNQNHARVDPATGRVFPRYNFSGYQNMGAQNPGAREARNDYRLEEIFATRWRSHRLSVTMDLRHTQINVFRPQYPEGHFQFTAGLTSLPGVINTGHSFASFLLGGASFAEQNVHIAPSYWRWNAQRYLFNDQWQLTPSLTLTIGMNLERYTQRTEKFDRQSNISFTEINPENGRPGALVAAARNGYGRAFTPNWLKLEPALGIAWSVLGDNNTVLRLNYQRRYSEPRTNPFQFGSQAFNGHPVWLSDNQQLTPAVVLASGLPRTMFPDLRLDAANGTTANLMDTSDRQPTNQNFSASLQRQLAAFLILTVSYTRQDGKNQFGGRNAFNPNAIPLSALVYRDQLNNLEFNRSLRPYPQFQDFEVANMWPGGRHRQTSLNFQLEKRTSGGLALTVGYEYLRRADNYQTNVQDFYNLNAAWALTPVNPHNLSVRYIYELPMGPGKPFLSSNGAFSYLLGGWSLSGVANYFSGNPLRLTPQFNNTGGVIQNLYVDNVPGVDPHVENPSPNLWFNPAAFVQPENFTAGNSARIHPTLRGPGGYNHDLTLSKRFPLAADRTLQFDASMFNATNHANWNDPDVRIGPASAPNFNAGKIIGSTGGRVVQLGLRLNF